jgi:hypothetical protein
MARWWKAVLAMWVAAEGPSEAYAVCAEGWV